MSVSTTTNILVISIDGDMESDLRYIANNQGWVHLQCGSLRQAMKHVIVTQPKIVILQVSRCVDKAIQLIRMIQTGWRRIPLIVTAVKHTDQLERNSRIAGATCYLSEHKSLHRIGQYVDAMLAPRSPVDATDRITSANESNNVLAGSNTLAPSTRNL
jgi:DNA-binding NarL/FixJ family response regulator